MKENKDGNYQRKKGLCEYKKSNNFQVKRRISKGDLAIKYRYYIQAPLISDLQSN
ncbi:unnamed protein product [Paramecium pentaurelia]|uniref:Uncharacterized protein n=1 Tax=Paramecium pentaurelia TaxID=43138 RepID=A0A8S1Y386_9CILI|nr:unnamed protein product [Paramecium pentaurelia]